GPQVRRQGDRLHGPLRGSPVRPRPDDPPETGPGTARGHAGDARRPRLPRGVRGLSRSDPAHRRRPRGGDMPLLKGDVEILGLGNLLQLLAMNHKEGILTLIRESDRKTIHFATKGMRLLSSSMKRINKLGKILLRRKRISKEDLDALLKEQKLLGWKLGQIAVESGLVQKKDVEEALREQIEEEIFDMFMWQQAAFEFAEGRAPKQEESNPLAGVNFDANMTGLILEAARRADELMMIRKILSDDDMSLTKFPFEVQVDELGADIDVVDDILPLMNGRRTVREVVNGSIYPRFISMRAIYKLLLLGYIKAQDRKGNTVKLAPPAEPVR